MDDSPPPATVPPYIDTHWSTPLCLVLVGVILAGMLFGYDQGVISSALTDIFVSYRMGLAV